MLRGTLLLLAMLAGLAIARGQEKTMQQFEGTKDLTTATFKVGDKWELRWSGASTLTLTVLDADGKIVAGTTASADGSLYQPTGGTFYLQLKGIPAAPAGAWRVTTVQLGSTPPDGSAAGTSYLPPSQISPPAAGSADLTLSTGTNAAPAASAAIAPRGKLSDAQARAIVLVKGDEGEGTGFLTHAADGTPVVVTNIHVISANPDPRITTTDGRDIPVLAYQGATDRDLVMMTIKDDHYSYLELGADIDHLVHEDDDVLTPGNSEGGEVFLDTRGKVRAIGPQKVEFSNPIYHGNSGGPVVQVSSGKVVAAVEGATRVDPTDELDQASLADAHSAITGTMRYFGLRLDTVPAWETYDLARFLTESTFLESFQRESRCLDSLMNGATYEKAGLPVSSGEEDLPSARYYLRDERLKAAEATFRQQALNADNSQQMDARRELFSDVSDVANLGMDQIEKPRNFYHFDQIRAKEEIEYRQVLLQELQKYSDKLGDLGH